MISPHWSRFWKKISTSKEAFNRLHFFEIRKEAITVLRGLWAEKSSETPLYVVDNAAKAIGLWFSAEMRRDLLLFRTALI